MATKLEKLLFAIGVKDDGASRAVAKLQSNIQGMTQKVQGHFQGMAGAAVGLVGSVVSIKGLIDPALELNRALGEVGQLGLDSGGLKHLQDEAGKFAMQYGVNANEVIRSSAAVQQAIDGLTAKELTTFATASNLLAKTGRSSVESMTGYMGSMYGIFERQAQSMGKSRWAEQMAGQTDQLARTLKLTGDDISASFSALGNAGVKAGIDAAEQMAVLGHLQKSMGASDAGSKYAAFINAAGKARKALGVSFKDQQGSLLGIGDILDQVRAKYGNALTEAQQLKFSNAIGDKDAGAFINTLLSKSGQLTKTVKDLRQVTGLADAKHSARQNTDAFQRFGASLDYVRANFMQKLTPVLNRWTNKATAHLETLNKWITRYPNVARAVGYAVLALAGLAGIVALATLGFHVWKVATMGVIGPVKGLTSMMKFLTAAIRANPIGFLITLLIAGIFYWDEITAKLGQFWTGLKSYFADVSWGGPFLGIMEDLEAAWASVTAFFTDFSWTATFKLVIANALKPLEWLLQTIGKAMDYAGIEGGAALKDFSAQKLVDGAFGPDPEPKALRDDPSRQVKFNGAAMAAQARAAGIVPSGAPGLGIAAANMPVSGIAASPVLEKKSAPVPVQLRDASGMPPRPQLASLQAARESSIPKGRILGAASQRVNNSGKTITIGEQHLHFETPPGSNDDLQALLLN